MLKEEIEIIMKLSGRARGAAFQTDAAYIREKKGEQGLRLLEQKTKEMGYPITYDKISAISWYPIGLRLLSLLAMQEVFGWGAKEIWELGDFAPKRSFIFKIIVRYLLSTQHAFEKSSKYYAMFFDIGVFEPVELNEDERYAILRIKDFKIHPIFCVYFSGFLRRVCQFLFKVEKTTIEETKCMFSGDPYHEFILRWE